MRLYNSFGILTKFIFLVLAIFVIALTSYVVKSAFIMRTVPFYDFDEAHRAENARRMKEYGSFIVPLTGSVFDRVEKFQISFRNNPHLHLYYHLERPTFVYWLMILSTAIFGSVEWAYRLPSFIFGMLTIVAYLFFAKDTQSNFSKQIALFVGLLSLVTSTDLWLSSQYAQLDTGLGLFLFLSIMSLITFCKFRKTYWLVISSISFSLAVLSKGQPAVIFIFPLAHLVLSRHLKLKDLLNFIIYSLVILGPWVIIIASKFGLINVIKIFSGFIISSAIVEDIHHKAPIFWYVRWWWESLRPGLTIFLALLFVDLRRKNLSMEKKALLAYILGSLLVLSIPHNKIWWYTLPLVPAIAYYIKVSTSDYLRHHQNALLRLTTVIIISSLPIFLTTTNRLGMIYGTVVTAVSITMLEGNFLSRVNLSEQAKKILFTAAVVFALTLFWLRFPQIIPYHWNIKPVGRYYANLPGQKCLWTLDMPPESALFYSDAGEVNLLTPGSSFMPDCTHYLMTPAEISDKKLIYQKGSMKLYLLKE